MDTNSVSDYSDYEYDTEYDSERYDSDPYDHGGYAYRRDDGYYDREALYDSDEDEYYRRPPAKRAERSTLFLNGTYQQIRSKYIPTYVAPLSLREKRDARWIVMKTMLAGYFKNANSILAQLPFDVLKMVIKNVKGLTDRDYRIYIKERDNYRKHLKNIPKGFTSTYHAGGIILCIPNR